MALVHPCRAKFYTNTASACRQPSSRGGTSQLTAPVVLQAELCRWCTALFKQRHGNSLLWGYGRRCFASWSSLAQTEDTPLLCPYGMLPFSTCWPENPCRAFSCHQFQQGQGATRHFRDQLRRSLWMLSISQGYTFGKVH